MNSVVIVTGASRGLGESTAQWLVRMGARVTLMARGKEALELVARRLEGLGGKVMAFAGDVADPDTCRAVVRETVGRFGGLTGLVNNAGVLQPCDLVASADPEEWRSNIAINLLGPFYMTQAALPELRQSRGRVVNVSSGAALHPLVGWSAYCVSKAGLTMLTRQVAAEESSITSLAFRPGVVDTDMQATIRRDGPRAMRSEEYTRFMRLKQEGKLEPPEVPGRVLAWLVLQGPHEWSGEMVDYDDPRLEALL